MTTTVRAALVFSPMRECRKLKILIACAVAVLAIVIRLSADDASRTRDAVLHIAGGDLLEINVFDVPELSGKFRLSNSGTLSLPLAGELQLQGMTVQQVEQAIARQLRDGGYLRDPQVSVLVAEFATQGVSVLGEVKKPGIYPSAGTHRLLDYLSMAEGLTPLAGSHANITHRDNSSVQRIELKSKGGARENPEVYSGDTVLVERAGVVYVVGDVARPGGFPMDQDNRLTVLQALALAQGANRTASLKSAKLIRTTGNSRTEVPINLSSVLASKSPDLQLQDEDILFVPTSAAKSAMKRGLEAGVQAAVGVVIYGRY
ncbi:MAG TPA: polysaccharide biosynthesis/export family protein [Terriglobales bacterium]|nr:polysaccharide biosynthesis/export family protein [Terriglobales bacterium]